MFDPCGFISVWLWYHAVTHGIPMTQSPPTLMMAARLPGFTGMLPYLTPVAWSSAPFTGFNCNTKSTQGKSQSESPFWAHVHVHKCIQISHTVYNVQAAAVYYLGVRQVCTISLRCLDALHAVLLQRQVRQLTTCKQTTVYKERAGYSTYKLSMEPVCMTKIRYQSQGHSSKH